MLLNLVQSSTLSPAQPTYVLRGHSAQVHSLHFLRDNLRLLSGDADGWVILWNIPIRRPVAVWQAHKDTVLGIGSWNDDNIITHGRDGKLLVWQLKSDEEPGFSPILPVEETLTERKQPWLLHSLTVNTMNFCPFAMCGESHGIVNTRFLVATPGVQDGYVNITTMPDEERTATIPTPKDVKTGMIMAIGLGYYNDKLTIVAGYESGHVAVWHQIPQSSHWQTVYVNKSHSQPILSLDICDQHQCFFTSSTDAVITRHPFPGSTVETKSTQTGHAGQQSLKVRSDQKLFATAGWDSRVRVYSVRTSKELAVLKWHKEGCYALAFANISAQGRDEHESTSEVAPDEQRSTISQQRVQKAQTTHWLAAGSKDGKISLWDVY